MKKQLNNCPKCGSDLIDIQSSRRMGQTNITCTDCGYSVSAKKDEYQTIKLWNLRGKKEGK